MSTCRGCDLPISASGGNRQREWCSDRCRKQTNYGVPCVGCGERLYNGHNFHSGEPYRCRACTDARSREHTRHWIVESVREWVELFGQPPTAVDWNQGMARASGCTALVERYERTGRPWPHPTVVQDNFGSWNAGLEAAGVETVASGKRRDPVTHRAAVKVGLRRAFGTQARREDIASMWSEGFAVREIADALDVQPGTVYHHMARMRDDGWDLPYRNPTYASKVAT